MTEKPCKGPCLGVWEVNYATDTSCAAKLKKTFKATIQSVYDFTKQITVNYGKRLETANTPSKLQKNACGEYLMLIEEKQLPGAGVSMTSIQYYPPKGKKAISSFFQSDVEYYQYLILRMAYGNKIGCKSFRLGDDTYLDKAFFEKREKLLLFLNSGFTTANEPVLRQAGVINAELYEVLKQKVIEDLFDDIKNQQAQVTWIEYVKNAENAHTVGELVGMIPFEFYVGAAKFGTNALKAATKSATISKFVNLVKGFLITNIQKKLIFHATTISGKNSIANEGVILSKNRVNLDFNVKGKGAFYMSESLTETEVFAKRLPAIFGEDAAILRFEIPERELTGLKIKRFASPDEEWAKFVTLGRKGELVHDFDIVIGPKLANPTQVIEKSAIPKALNEIQFVLTSEKSSTIFSKYLVKQK